MNEIESLLATGDIGKMSSDQRVAYYRALCESTGLNPVAQPFEYLQLQGKTVLYAKRQATEQLRKLHNISVQIIQRETVGDIHSVIARATSPDGRCDESVGAVSIAGLKGEALSNAFMKAETKAKRRVTLSMCALGMLDESEVASVPNAKTVRFDDTPAFDAIPTTPALMSADREIALAEIAQASTADDLRALAPRLAVLAPKSAPYRADVAAAYRQREQAISAPAPVTEPDPENDGR